MKNLLKALPFVGLAIILVSCGSNERSRTTNWKYNDQDWGGFEKKVDYQGQETPPNMVLIPGGSFIMGFTEDDVPYDWNNISRRVTVSTFYMDQTEITNEDYLLYLDWTRKVYGDYPEVLQKALPDTLVWREELAYNEPYLENYLRHPSYSQHPVVGVTWVQAREYSRWRTDRVNEAILIDRGIQEARPDQSGSDVFVTDSYLAGQYEGVERKGLRDYRTGETRPVRLEDGILQPDFRLPTEAEWEYAALALPGLQANEKDENYTDRRIYPWSGTSMRHQRHDRQQGMMVANFKRRAGDYSGIAGKPNDGASLTAPVFSNPPNDFGLYNMAGNVNEWVLDLYRPLTTQTLQDVENHDLNAYRGNDFQDVKRDQDGRPVEKDEYGRLIYAPVEDADVAERDNYTRGRVYDYLDGDEESEAEYASNEHTLISDKARVYKGGSWADRAYWLSPGTRRFKDQDKASRDIGFRCAMIRVGESLENGPQKTSEPKRRRRSRR